VIQEKQRKRLIDAERKTKYIRYSKQAILNVTCMCGGKRERERKEAWEMGKRTEWLVVGNGYVEQATNQPSKQTRRKED
jgi:hypothetical protein